MAGCDHAADALLSTQKPKDRLMSKDLSDEGVLAVEAFAPTGQAPNAPVEFDHAITYVTTIKKRFAHQPETYKSFLEILHTYQKEQRSIKDVLEQVSQLFAEHADLLKEFTYFLPDAVQEQAKERLCRAARESEIRMGRVGATNPGQGATMIGGDVVNRPSQLPDRVHRSSSTSYASLSVRTTSRLNCQAQARPQHTMRNTIRHITPPSQHVHTVHPSSRASKTPVTHSAMGTAPYSGQNFPTVLQYFDRVKDALNRSSSDDWAEFLKCLDLYAHDLILRHEFLQLLLDLLGKHPQLFAEFIRLLTSHGGRPHSIESDVHETASGSGFSRQTEEMPHPVGLTPSYWSVPRERGLFPFQTRYGLNESLVSKPLGSAETYSFKYTRKNHCEEVIFRSEDDHFDLDIMIESNNSLVRLLDEVHKQPPDSASPSLKRKRQHRCSGLLSLSALHIAAITRLYGDETPEILDLLISRPADVIPVLLRRLGSKNAEWRRLRQIASPNWCAQLQRNYHKALDYRSYFKQREKRRFATHGLDTGELVTLCGVDADRSSLDTRCRRFPVVELTAKSSVNLEC